MVSFFVSSSFTTQPYRIMFEFFLQHSLPDRHLIQMQRGVSEIKWPRFVLPDVQTRTLLV